MYFRIKLSPQIVKQIVSVFSTKRSLGDRSDLISNLYMTGSRLTPFAFRKVFGAVTIFKVKERRELLDLTQDRKMNMSRL